MQKIFLTLLALALAAGCTKTNGSSSADTMATSNGYYNKDGYCYSWATNQQVPTSYCSATTNGYSNSGYYNKDGFCYSWSTNQQVATSYCSATGNTSGACYGNYIFNQYGHLSYGVCYGWNCSGYTLTEAQTGRTVYCQ